MMSGEEYARKQKEREDFEKELEKKRLERKQKTKGSLSSPDLITEKQRERERLEAEKEKQRQLRKSNSAKLITTSEEEATQLLQKQLEREMKEQEREQKRLEAKQKIQQASQAQAQKDKEMKKLKLLQELNMLQNQEEEPPVKVPSQVSPLVVLHQVPVDTAAPTLTDNTTSVKYYFLLLRYLHS